MTNILQPKTRKQANQMFTSTFTFVNMPKSIDSTYDQSQQSEMHLRGSAGFYSEEKNQNNPEINYSKKPNVLWKSNQIPRPSRNTIDNYEKNDDPLTLETVLKNQNKNLKKQNQLLLSEIRKLRKSNKKYHEIHRQQKIQLMEKKQECERQTKKTAAIKGFILNELMIIEDKISEPDFQQSHKMMRKLIMEQLNLSKSTCYWNQD